MIKVKVTSNWCNNSEIKKRLIDQFGTKDSLDGIEFVDDDQYYDLIVAFGYITELPTNNKPIFVFPQEPTWSGSHQKLYNNIDNIKVFGFDIDNYSPKNVVDETIAHMFYGGRGPWEEGHENWNFDNIQNYKFEKNKNICSFVSNRGIGEEDFDLNCLYGKRTKLISENYKKLDFVDFYGWGNEDNLKPHVSKKWDGLKSYKFCLTIENSHEKNYISEKFYDCILTNTIPIYFGCNNIQDYWTENSYILLDNIDDFEYVNNKLLWINRNSDKIYNDMLPELLTMKKRYFTEYNLIEKIKKEYYGYKKSNN